METDNSSDMVSSSPTPHGYVDVLAQLLKEKIEI